MKTFSQKPADVTRRWILIDAHDAPLGRLSTEIAKYLIGKYKPTSTPHTDGGDYVVVINASKAVVSVRAICTILASSAAAGGLM